MTIYNIDESQKSEKNVDVQVLLSKELVFLKQVDKIFRQNSRRQRKKMTPQ